MRNLMSILPKRSGRSHGKITVRHQGGRHKRFYREIDFKRDKKDVWGVIEKIDYDPNRNARIAMVLYKDGERRYILAPDTMVVGHKIVAGAQAQMEVGHTMALSRIAIGTLVHNIEIIPGKGGQIVRSAGTAAIVQGREEKHVLVKLPSAEVRRFNPDCMATIGQVGNIEAKNRVYTKAGQKRWLGIRPTVRGTAQDPRSHPHGGGEGRSGIGLKYPKTPWGKPAVGRTRHKKKHSRKLIVKRRS